MKGIDDFVKTIKITGNLNILSYSRTQNLLSIGGADDFAVWLVDLSQVESVDSSGMGALLSFHEKLSKRGKEVALISPSKACVKVMYLLGLQNIFWIYENREKALKTLLPISSGKNYHTAQGNFKSPSPWKYLADGVKRLGAGVNLWAGPG